MKSLRFYAGVVLAAVLLLGVGVVIASAAQTPLEVANDPMAPQAQLPYTVTVSVSPTVKIVPPGETTIILEAFIEGIPVTETLGAFQLTLEYNDAMLDAKTGWGTNTTINMDWLMPPPNQRSWTGLTAEPSSTQVMIAGNSTSNPAGLPGPYGDGVVALYEFDVLPGASGSIPITIGVGGADSVNNPAGDVYYVVYKDGGRGQVVVPVTQTLVVNVEPAAAGIAGCSVTQTPGPPYMTTDPVELDPQNCTCYTFDHWSGVPLEGSTDDPASITMDDDYTVTAHFVAPTYTLDVNVVGNGTVDKVPDKTAYDCGEDVELTANAAANARFVEWSGPDAPANPTENPTTVHMDADKSLTATFVDTHTVTVGPSVPPEGGTVTVVDENGDGFYDDGETITVTATPADACWVFDGWTGTQTGTQNPLVIVLSADEDFAATFHKLSYNLVVNVVNAEGVTGTVTLDPPGGVYSCCTTVTLTASIAEGVGVFDGWSGDLTGKNVVETIHMDGNKVVTATFLGTIPWIFPENPGGGTISTEPEQPEDGFVPNTVVTLTATPDYCYQFDGWTGDLASYGTQTPLVLTATEPLSFSAEFSQIEYAALTVNVVPVGKGTVEIVPESEHYACGTTITATATATETTWVFDYWSGAATGSDNPVSFTIDEDSGTTLTAHFKQYHIFLPVVAKNYTP